MNQLSNAVKIEEAIATTGAGTSTLDGALHDMSMFETILFVAKFSTPAADNTLKASQGNQAGGGDQADLEGSSVAVGASDDIVWLEITKPKDRYVQVHALRGTSTVLEWCVAMKGGAHVMPVDNATAGTIAGEAHVSPAEGTA